LTLVIGHTSQYAFSRLPTITRITTQQPTPEGWKAELAMLVDHQQMD